MILASEVHGDRGAPAVALLHSLALDRSVWRGVVPALSPRWQLVALDLRGHGESPHDDRFLVEDLADDVVETLGELGVDRFAVVGLSLGGCVAQAVATRHPQRVTALGLVDTTAWYGPDAPAAWEARAQKASTEGLDSLRGFQLDRWFGAEFLAANPELGEDLLDRFTRTDLASYVATCRAMGAFDGREALEQVSVPAVVVVGEHDPATPVTHAEDLVRRLSGADLTVLPDAKHLTALERPAEISRIIEQLLERSVI